MRGNWFGLCLLSLMSVLALGILPWMWPLIAVMNVMSWGSELLRLSAARRTPLTGVNDLSYLHMTDAGRVCAFIQVVTIVFAILSGMQADIARWVYAGSFLACSGLAFFGCVKCLGKFGASWALWFMALLAMCMVCFCGFTACLVVFW